MQRLNSLSSIHSCLSISSVETINGDAKLPGTDDDDIDAFPKYSKIGTLTDLIDVKESICTKHYDEEGNKYYNEYKFIKFLGHLKMP